jgi:hypothetical protein
MLSRSGKQLALILCFVALALLLPTGEALGQKKGNTKSIDFPSYDGVTLKGTYYPANAGKNRDAVVMLLHHFDIKQGGGRQQAGWSDLAKALQDDGYNVLSFDFRGFGESTTVDAATFWTKYPFNSPFNIRKGKGKDTINHKDFSPNYLPYLVNDIAAAKAYLDRRNDNKELNSSNVIVIGAGEGATLGAMWMANEARRRKDKGRLGIGVPMMGDAESKDLAAGIWLTISTKSGGRSVYGSLKGWVGEAGKWQKVPMLFVFGQKDGSGGDTAKALVKAINPQGAKNKDFKNTGTKAIPDTKLAGHLLLDKEYDTIPIIKKYLAGVLDDRGSKESIERKIDKSRYVYTYPAATTRGLVKYLRDNKPAGQDVPGVDLSIIK